jgi:cob(I)alamin adenosyltransferase
MVSQLRALPNPLPGDATFTVGHKPPLQHPMLRAVEGSLQVFTSQHRTFFTNVMVQATRIAEHGLPVLIVQFLKGGINQGPNNPVQMGQNLTWLRSDCLECVTTADVSASTQAAIQALWKHTQAVVNEGKYSLVVLDELSLAIDLGIIKENELLSLLKKRPAHVEMILTGPQMPDSLLNLADQVTEFRRHYVA